MWYDRYARGMTRKELPSVLPYRIYIATHTLGKQHARPVSTMDFYMGFLLASLFFKFVRRLAKNRRQSAVPPHLFIPVQNKGVHINARTKGCVPNLSSLLVET